MAAQHRNLPLSVYVPGTTVIHRLRPSYKIAFLIIYIAVTSFACTTVERALVALGISAAIFLLGRIPLRITISQVWPPLCILIPLAAFQWWTHSWERAVITFAVLLGSMLLAFLLTLTSTVDDILGSLDAALKPLGKLGVPVDNISLAMALTIRLIPLMLGTAYEVLDARKARGAGLSPRAFATPILVRSLRRARAIAEALQARGVGD